MDENLYVVIMAGGRGERFWPQSRASHPKQLLRLIGNLTLIEQTAERMTGLVKPENCLVITNHEYVASMRSLLRWIPPDNIIGEIHGRDTGPCVAMASALVRRRSNGNENAALIVMPSDHVIGNAAKLRQTLSDAVTAARKTDKPVVLGVTPVYPATGFGYVKYGDREKFDSETGFFKGEGFKEKPSRDEAKSFVKCGSYKWNSGMFVWTLGTLERLMTEKAHWLLDLSAQLADADEKGTLEEVAGELYGNIAKISIDYSLMEHVSDFLVADCEFEWNDVGSWTALRSQIRSREHGNIVRGLFHGVDTHNCIISGDSTPLIATVGVKDLIIVHTPDATLVCDVQSAQKVKELVHQLADKPEFKPFV